MNVPKNEHTSDWQQTGGHSAPTIYDSLLLEKRSWISRFPENKSVVMLVSGGPDSIITMYRLLKEGMKIYPLFLNRGQKNFACEQESSLLFCKKFQEQFPEQCAPLKIMTVAIPPPEIKSELQSYSKTKGYPVRDPLLLGIGVEYAIAIEQIFADHVRTVFCAYVPSDKLTPHTNLETLRATTIMVCEAMKDWEWLISSPNIDSFLFPELFHKSDEFKLAIKDGLPIDKMVSCDYASEKTGKKACGVCKYCHRRKELFSYLNLPDPTRYLEEVV